MDESWNYNMEWQKANYIELYMILLDTKKIKQN